MKTNHLFQKPLILLSSLLLSFSVLFAQNKFTASQWQQDLRFLQKTVHDDYAFLFKKTTEADFDAAVEQLYVTIPQLQDHEILTGIARIIASFKYGHTRVGFSDSPIPLHFLKVNMYQFNDGVFIQGAHKDYEKALGAKVVAMEGTPIKEVLEAIYPVVPAENDQFFKAYGVLYALSPEILHAQGITETLQPSVRMTFEKDGETFDLDIAAQEGLDIPISYGFIEPKEDWLQVRNQETTPLYLKNLDKIYFYEYLPEEKTVYVRQSQIQDDPSEDIPTFYARVFDFIENNDVDKLILDVRLNGGGNNYKNKPVVTGIIETEKINQPGKLFVIIGRRTFSACQNLVNELSNYTNAIFVGEPTSENINFYGDNRQVQLPNTKLNTYLSFAWWQDKPQWEGGPWTAPHIAVDMSFDQYVNNEDPVLQEALAFEDDAFVINPMRHFTELFQAGKIEQLEADAQRMVGDPKYRFFNFEGEFNEAGYNLLNANRVEEAIYVFTMNATLFPDSANCWDSLAEGYWKAGDLAKAEEYYSKAIQMDPNGRIGNNARSMLKKMKEGSGHK